jgi:hypothetical protein
MEPTMTQDAQGHYLSGATAAAATAYDDAVRAFYLVHGDVLGLFNAARETAPDFAMAHLGKAWVLGLANDPGLMIQAKALVETARPLPSASKPTSPRCPIWSRALAPSPSRYWTAT